MSNERSQHALDAAADSIVAGRAADGDTLAFALLVRRYGPMMRAYARRILSETAEVDDVVQDAFVTAWQQLPELEEAGRVKSWLMRITSRKAIDRLRAKHPQEDITEIETATPAHSAPPRQVENKARVATLNAVLAELPDAQRQCWVLREIGGYGYDEIAETLDLPLSTVRGQLARARKYIIVRMEQWR